MALYGVSFLVCSLLLLQFFYLVHFAKEQNIFQKKIWVFADLFCSPVLLIIYFCCIDKLSQFDDFTLPDRNYCHFTCVYFFVKISSLYIQMDHRHQLLRLYGWLIAYLASIRGLTLHEWCFSPQMDGLTMSSSCHSVFSGPLLDSENFMVRILSPS